MSEAMIEQEAIVDVKLINKFALHKAIANGGSIGFNGSFGIRFVYNDKNPNSPFIEARVFMKPVKGIYKGNINPSLHKQAKLQAMKEEEVIEEGETIDM